MDYFPTDAEAEVDQGGEADEEADDGVEMLERDRGDKANQAAVRDRVAEERNQCRKDRVHGNRRGRAVECRAFIAGSKNGRRSLATGRP